MRTEKQIHASRVNGAASHGPASVAGKRKSSANSARHHLLSETVVLETERLDAFDDLLAALTREFNPQTETQRCLVETMAIARWRLMRIWGLERATLDSAIEKYDPLAHEPSARAAMGFRALADESRTLDVLHRYEVRYDRQFARALNQLTKLASPDNPLSQFCQTNPSAESGVGLPACAGAEGASPSTSEPPPPTEDVPPSETTIEPAPAPTNPPAPEPDPATTGIDYPISSGILVPQRPI
jgi:hypothetical protein